MDSCMTELENRQRRQRHKIPRMNRMYCTTRRLKILPGHLMVCLSGLKHFPSLHLAVCRVPGHADNATSTTCINRFVHAPSQACADMPCTTAP
jgi:hypothetical protein